MSVRRGRLSYNFDISGAKSANRVLCLGQNTRKKWSDIRCFVLLTNGNAKFTPYAFKTKHIFGNNALRESSSD